MLKEYFKIALQSIRHRGLRSWLTMVGIFIGIAAVVSLFSLGQGLENTIREEFVAMGADMIVILPEGATFGLTDTVPAPLTMSDVRALRNVRGVDEVSYVSARYARVEWGNEVVFGYVIGFPEEAESLVGPMLDIDVVEGRMIRQGDRYSVFVGYDYPYSDSFRTNAGVGNRLDINGVRFNIVGVNREWGNQIDDRMIVMPIDVFNDLFDTHDQVDRIFLRVAPGQQPGEVLPGVIEELRRNRGLREGQEDFEADSVEDLLESYLAILTLVTTVIVGIAAISLVVGAVGIANTMYMSVMERTRDIGVMKAIGARNRDVLSLFLLESGLLGLAGGAIGVAIGVGFAKIVEGIAAQYIGEGMLVAFIPLWLIIGALLFAFTLGVISGVMPARQAARMNPVDSLRYE